MKVDATDDELVMHVIERDEGAFDILLSRYKDIIDILIWELLKRNRYCGLDYDDLKQNIIETTLMVCQTYDPHKSCFFGYWKLIGERELVSYMRRMNSCSITQLNTALSFDAGDESEKNRCFARAIDEGPNDVIAYVNGRESVSILSESFERYLSPLDNAIIAYRVLGESYEKIENTLQITHRKLCRRLLFIRQKAREIAKDYR